MKNLYAECMALEELLEEAVNTLGPDARDILTQVRWAGTAVLCELRLISCARMGAMHSML